MKNYPRIYRTIVDDHFSRCGQMAFLSGPRQVGKTTVGEGVASHYLSWDDDDVRRTVLSGQKAVIDKYALASLSKEDKIVVFDEIHKYRRWKQFLKGFYDAYAKGLKVIVTGSAKMDVYKKGGDSMMGRYFPYRMHPLSVAELLDVSLPPDSLVRSPAKLKDGEWDALLRYGGFPDPFVRRDARFSRRWNALRFEQLTQVDIRDLTQIVELDQLKMLAEILGHRSGEQLVYASLGKEVQVSEITTRNWVATLCSFYFGFLVKPWSQHMENAIRKTPKWFLRDWSGITDIGKRNETILACHLLKAVEYWTDMGFGECDLYYIRDKQKKEADFLVSKDGKPWFLAEAKTSDTKLSPALSAYQKATGAKHAFQVVFNLPFEDVDCFTYADPTIVPAKTFLSQLV